MDGWTDGFILEGLHMWEVSVAIASYQSFYCKRTGALAFPAWSVQQMFHSGQALRDDVPLTKSAPRVVS